MKDRNKPLFGWPGWKTYLSQQLLAVLFTVVFLVFYGGASRLADAFTSFHRVHMDWEMHIPFIPGLVFVYLSMHLLLSLAPFIFRSLRALTPLVLTLCTMIIVASGIFLLFPVQQGFVRPPQPGFWFNLADGMNFDHNEVPSLHTGLSFAAALAYGHRCGALGRSLFIAWALAIALSTLFIHEHQVLDLFTGFLLALIAMKWIYPWIGHRFETGNEGGKAHA